MQEKKGKRQRLWSWSTNKYQLIIRNEENFAEKTTVSFNYAKAFLLFLVSFTMIFILSLFLSRTILSQWFDPEHGNKEQAKQIQEFESRELELEERIATYDDYIKSFKVMLNGGQSIADSVPEESSISNIEIEEELPEVDSIFRAKYESSTSTLVSSEWRGGFEEITDMYFIAPVNRGEPIAETSSDVSRKYNLKQEHFGIDIVAKEDAPIKSVSDGTVFMSGWTDDNGYVVGVQHKNNVLSFYKHNSVVLKKVGDFVKTGDIIAIIGNTGGLSRGTHLHFELWYKGQPVNPEYFITF